MNFFNLFRGAMLALGLATGMAQASSVDFEVGAGSGVTLTNQWCVVGCAVTAGASSGLVGTSFSLGVGETYSFDFIDIAVVRSGRGYFPIAGTFQVASTLSFANPGGGISTPGAGGFGSFGGIISAGVLLWDDAVQTVVLGNGTEYTVRLDQGLAVGPGTSATVRAHVTLDVAPVPLPATALLLIAGIGGIGVVRLRRRSAAPA